MLPLKFIKKKFEQIADRGYEYARFAYDRKRLLSGDYSGRPFDPGVQSRDGIPFIIWALNLSDESGSQHINTLLKKWSSGENVFLGSREFALTRQDKKGCTALQEIMDSERFRVMRPDFFKCLNPIVWASPYMNNGNPQNFTLYEYAVSLGILEDKPEKRIQIEQTTKERNKTLEQTEEEEVKSEHTEPSSGSQLFADSFNAAAMKAARNIVKQRANEMLKRIKNKGACEETLTIEQLEEALIELAEMCNTPLNTAQNKIDSSVLAEELEQNEMSNQTDKVGVSKTTASF